MHGDSSHSLGTLASSNEKPPPQNGAAVQVVGVHHFEGYKAGYWGFSGQTIFKDSWTEEECRAYMAGSSAGFHEMIREAKAERGRA